MTIAEAEETVKTIEDAFDEAQRVLSVDRARVRKNLVALKAGEITEATFVEHVGFIAKTAGFSVADTLRMLGENYERRGQEKARGAA